MIKESTSRVVSHYFDMIVHSWTWDRMTLDERNRFVDSFDPSMITGGESTRYRSMQAIYAAFLAGLGYDGPGWRETIT